MQSHCAVLEPGEGLKGSNKMDEILDNISQVKVSDKSLIWNTDLLETIELENLIQQAVITVKSAENRESRGAHARDDFTERNDEDWLFHSLAWLKDKKTQLGSRPVTLRAMSNEVQSFLLKQGYIEGAMVELLLPKNSKVKRGKNFELKEQAKNKSFFNL